MDPGRFDRLAMAVGRHTTRRTALAVLSALGLTGLVREEAGAICDSPGEKCTRDRGYCSGICGNKRNTCKCPQRFCCQCFEVGVPCAYAKDQPACAEYCLKRTGNDAALNFFPNPGIWTTVCEGTQCRTVDCVPT